MRPRGRIVNVWREASGSLTRNKMFKDERYHAACHEAAHAVACLLLGQGFDRIQLQDQPRMVHGIPGVSMGQFIPTSEKVYGYEGRCVEAQISLAGLAFEKLLRPSLTWFALALGQCRGDFDQALEWTRRALDNSREAEPFMLRVLLPPVREVLVSHWGAIAEIGRVLAERGKLSQPEVVAILEDVRPKRSSPAFA